VAVIFFFFFFLISSFFSSLYSLGAFVFFLYSHRIRKGGKTTTFRVPDAKCIRNLCLPPLLAWYFLKLPSKSIGQQRDFHSFFFFSKRKELKKKLYIWGSKFKYLNWLPLFSKTSWWLMMMHFQPWTCISFDIFSLFIYFLHFYLTVFILEFSGLPTLK
jgi:hypothetical protein